MSFKDKVVIVTGASSGIGAAIAEAFSAASAKVVIVGRNETKLEKVAASCENPLIIRADLAKDDDVKLIVDKTIEKFGKIDILINNAATCCGGSLFDGNIMRAFDFNIRVNIRAIIYLTSLVAPHIIKTKGNIVNISSIAGHTSTAASTALTYNVSKAALNHFNTCIAAELASLGVRVNAVSPGPVRTDFLDNNDYPTTWDAAKELTALNRVSDATEIADLVLYLTSDKAKAVTGVNYISDNGFTLKNR